MDREERALLDAIRADPTDDAVRLIYADWLEEHGQSERGELIRVQIALETNASSTRLVGRENKLLARRCEWLGPLEKVGVYFHRGLPEARWYSMTAFRKGSVLLASLGEPERVVARRLWLQGDGVHDEAILALVRAPGYQYLSRLHIDDGEELSLESIRA